MPLLSLLLAIPAIGALSIAVMDPQHTRLIRGAATATATATLLLSLRLLAGFDTGEAGLPYAELHSWNPELGSFYALGVDGLSLPMVLLSALLSLIALLASYSPPIESRATMFACSCWNSACSAYSWPRTGRFSTCSGKSH